jgi:Cu/Ag efflux pump CusA
VLEINLAVGIGATVLTAVLLEMNARRRLEKARKNAEKETKFNKSPNAK